MRALFIILLISFFVGSCKKFTPEKLVGDWQAAIVLEEKSPLPIDQKEIKLHFEENGNYQYFGTLNYKEAGTFFIEKDLLYTLDTINKASTEKAVKIILLTPDSLHIKMNENGNERIVMFFKTQ